VNEFQHATRAVSMKHPSVQNRLRVQLHRTRLDRQLAEGVGSDSTEDRALRARQLARRRTRRRLARSLRARVNDAERPIAPHLSAAVPLSCKAVLSSREGLLGLAERLDSPDPLNPCGVARVLVLLTDGAGPLYSPAAADRLRDAVWWVADGLALDADEYPAREPA
jgi:hypothetical protein